MFYKLFAIAPVTLISNDYTDHYYFLYLHISVEILKLISEPNKISQSDCTIELKLNKNENIYIFFILKIILNKFLTFQKFINPKE